VPDAGTYWFHSHVGTQLDRGLYGPLIIEECDATCVVPHDARARLDTRGNIEIELPEEVE